jgi:polar amino acid transport system substrate-binding protein
MRRSLVVHGLGWILLLVVGCAGWLPGSPELRVGIQTDYPPLAFEREGELVGIEAELASKLGQALERRVRFQVMDRKALIPALERGEVDVVMAGMSVTSERSARVRFVESYADVGQMALLRRDDLRRLGGDMALRRRGSRVGFVRGTTGEAYVRGQLPAAIPVTFETLEGAERALRAGEVDYFVHDAPTAWRLGMNPNDQELVGLFGPLTHEELAWAVRKDDEELGERLDALVSEWKQRGEIERILYRWVPVRVTQ